jgi:hypothetical protein
MAFKSCAIPAVFGLCLASIGGTTPVHADIINVPADQPTIQAGIAAANPGDEVVVAPGTYLESINFLGKAITLRSSDGPEVTIIDAQETGTVVTCNSGEGSDSVLEGFTITGGDAVGFPDYGGGMRNVNSSPTVIDCTFSENLSEFGSGMYNDNSSPTVTDCTFSGNTGSFGGGMANVNNSSPTVTNCMFSGNTVFPGGLCGGGGGMYNHNSNPTVTNCTFSGNAASQGVGGGMQNITSSSPTLTNCTFSGNTAGGYSCSTGGAMHNSKESSPTVTNCILWGDVPDEIINHNPDLDHPTVRYSNVQGALPAGTVDGGGNIDADPLFVAFSNCCFRNEVYAPGCSESECETEVCNADPSCCDLWWDSLCVQLAEELCSICPNDDRLLPGSPCIDAADNEAVPKDVTTDFDGNPRFVDDPETRDTGLGKPPIVDMGAFELQVPCLGDLNGDGIVNARDIVQLVHAFGPCDGCPEDLNGDGVVNPHDLRLLIENLGPCE